MQIKQLIILFSLIVFAVNVQATPITQPIGIKTLRPYSTGAVFVYLDGPPNSTQMVGVSYTCTTVYLVEADSLGKDELVAALFIAYAQGKDIQIEIPTGTTDCQVWGTKITSIYLN